MPWGPRVTTRRTALGGALAGMLALSACDLESLDPRSAPEDEDPGSAPAVDADSALVDAVLVGLAGTIGELAKLRRSSPAARKVLSSFIELHRAHADVLGTLPDTSGRLPETAGADVMTQLRSIETRAQRDLTEAAVRAESGALARLLASMSAGVAQYLEAGR